MLNILAKTGLSILDKVIEDPDKKREAKERLLQLAQDGKLQELQKELESQADARAHDKASYGNSKLGQIVDFMRGIVRPIITFTAFSFFVYAKVESIPFGAEDYAIIGGILAFWFGGRFIGKDVQKV